MSDIRDTDSVYLFSDNLELDATLPLTLADVALHRHMTVAGCYPVQRDPLLDPRADSILDPDGDRAYRRELAFGRPVVMKRCNSHVHRGRRDLPATEFSDGDDVCRGCRGIIEHMKRGASTPERGRAKNWRRGFHADGRRGNFRNFHPGA